MNPEIHRVLKDFFLPNDAARLVIVYGSFARNAENQHSDIDLAVLFKQKLSLDERLELGGKLSQALGREVDLVDLRETSGVLLQEILTRGTIILKRDCEEHADLIRRMVNEEADFMPIYRKILKERREKFLGIKE